ncbi:50S ribosomal protein L21 [Candidatus Peregrinibacteria bacterium]|nr:MAG: 50S ribosomal protein L21 [Candidatus Peregrinibacteria bacterium]
MFAVVYFGGKQYKVREKDELEVEKLDLEAGKNFKINEVLLMAEEDGSEVKLGMPFVVGAHVECQVVEQGLGEKIRVFKMKAKKRYHKTQGHRQAFTAIKVLKISAVERKTSVPAKEEEDKEVKAEPKAEKVEKKTVAKKPAAKKTAKKD